MSERRLSSPVGRIETKRTGEAIRVNIRSLGFDTILHFIPNWFRYGSPLRSEPTQPKPQPAFAQLN